MSNTCGFYWLEHGRLAGSAYPGSCLEWLYLTQGIRAIISLEPLKPPDLDRAKRLGFQVLTVEISDFTAGSPEQRNRVIQAIDDFYAKNLATLIHCQGGLGRTGMILAIYLVQRHGIEPHTAIAQIRALRAGSIEANTGQEEAIIMAKEKTSSKSSQ